jgi:hypothetical protein
LIDYIRFYVPLKNISLIWRRHHYRWRAAKFRPMLGARGLWAGRDLYRATPAVTRGLGFSGLIRRTATFSRLLRHTRGCGGSILTRILMCQLSMRNMKLKILNTFMVTIATAAILEMVNIAKALTHGGYCFCEVWSQKVQPSPREFCTLLWLPWQRQKFRNFWTLDTHRSMAVIVSVKYHRIRSNDLQNCNFLFSLNTCGFHGNGGHLGVGKCCKITGPWWLSFVWSFTRKGLTILEKN